MPCGARSPETPGTRAGACPCSTRNHVSFWWLLRLQHGLLYFSVRECSEKTMPNGDYEYDVFLSYRRDRLVLEWIVEVEQRLKFWLSQELGGNEARIFVDQDCIEIGDRWPDRLRAAVRSSRCMVGIWSPRYFQSAWCISEWQSFRAREQRLGLDIYGLIAPVRFHDGEHFPQEAADVQCADFSEYTSTIPAFWQSQRAVEFEGPLRAFARSVATIIRRTPPFQADWPVVEAQPIIRPIVELRRL